jgi:hypothetical protein
MKALNLLLFPSLSPWISAYSMAFLLMQNFLSVMANSMEIYLSGTKLHCGACALAKAKAKSVPKATAKKSNKPGGSLFLDISGPYLESMGGSNYWQRVVDDYTRYAWDCFLTKKSDLQKPFEALLTKIKGLGFSTTLFFHVIMLVKMSNISLQYA